MTTIRKRPTLAAGMVNTDLPICVEPQTIHVQNLEFLFRLTIALNSLELSGQTLRVNTG